MGGIGKPESATQNRIIQLLQQELGYRFLDDWTDRADSCNPASRNIRLNTDLAKKPPECLEYIVVHELAHLIEATHNARFVALMDLFLPQWRHLKDVLNRLPVRHEDWAY